MFIVHIVETLYSIAVKENFTNMCIGLVGLTKKFVSLVVHVACELVMKTSHI